MRKDECMITKTVVDSDFHLFKDMRERLVKDLENRKVAIDKIFDIQVSFEEALRNAVIHGNKSNPDKKVTIEMEINEDMIMVAIEDEGEGFDPAGLPDPTLEENLLKETGRGVYLIYKLMDRVMYENSGRKVVMIKYLNE